MRCAMWPRLDAGGHEAEMTQILQRGQLHGMPGAVLVADAGDGALCGFVELSIKPMDGFETSPVAYVEGWFVDEAHRRRGIGRKLLEGAERWAATQGRAEIGSGCGVENRISHAGHLACGFSEIRDEIFFRKRVSMEQSEAPETLSREPAGSEEEWIELTESPLRVEDVVRFVSNARAGGINMFLGTTRAETSGDGRELVALEYEAYAEMALRRMRELAREAREKWPIVKLAMVHRIGRVGLAQASVLIAVSTPHRGDAFAACRWLIDQLKVDVPIWKKEIWSEGEGTWVHPG
jgi:molybdopterin synthase catalytic subunit